MSLDESSTHADTVAPVAPKIAFAAEPFDPRDVTLTAGPFHHAMELDRKYLLSLDPDRLLHNFRVTAGLPSTATPYGGWEAPDCEVRGHFTGHYLTACARMSVDTGDERLAHNARYMAHELAKCQAKLGNGYLSAYPESFIDRVEAFERVWAPYYTLHKIYAGLMDVYTYLGDREALDVARRMGEWVKGRCDRLSDEQMERMLGNEHGGMNETLADLYALTGDARFLALSRRFNHHAVLDPLAKREDHLTGLHANTQIPKVIGAARQYELTGEPAYRTVATYFWEVVTRERSYVIGGHSDGEHFSPKERLSQYLSPDTAETCNTYNMLKLTRHLFQWEAKAEYADYYERAVYNHILASQNPKTGMMCYFVPLRSGSQKSYNGPEDAFWCCTGTGIENHARYDDAIYFHHGGERLYVNLFIPSRLHWREAGVVLQQETKFPDEGATKLTLHCDAPHEFELRLRRPAWAGEGFAIKVNGQEMPVGEVPGSFVALRRRWSTGDTVEVTLPMRLHVEAFRDNPNRVAYLCGPIVLSAALDDAVLTPALVADAGALERLVRPVPGHTLEFRGDETAFRKPDGQHGNPLTFTPLFRKAEGHYGVYWDVFDEARWRTKQAEYRAEQEHLRDIAQRTVDVVHPNEEQSERDHNLQSEKSYSGDFGHRKYRDARDGGWFTYDLKVEPDGLQELSCAYWGSDFRREFEILVDGMHLATQKLDSSHPDRFFDVVYPLPESATKGKSRVQVRFQAPAGGMAGGVFECRLLRRKAE